MQRSFLPHQKGAAREACSMGHTLEKPILEKWILETQKRGYPIRGLGVKAAYTAGLVAKKCFPWAKDSIDFVLLTSNNGLDNNPWGVEVKARVTPRTAADEEEFVTCANREKNMSVASSEVHEMISAVGERFQCLHHAYVYNFSKIVFMVGDSQSEILQSTIIEFDEDLMEHYGNVLTELKDLALSWAYDENNSNQPKQLPEELVKIAKTLPNIKDDEAIQGTANLWLHLNSRPLPMPSFIRLIPAVCAYWNAVKSGSDTTTKLMDDRVLFPPHVNAETIATTRLILLSFVIIHRLIQVITAKENLNFYPSLDHYRNAACQRTTFHKTILSINSFLKMKQKAEERGDIDENQNSSQQQRNITASRNARPIRQRVLGVVPQQMEFGVQLPFETPKKLKKKINKKEVSEPICKMFENCTGRPVQLVDVTKKQRCAVCKKTTTYYCAGCKNWFCFCVRITKNNPKDKINLLHYNVKGKREFFYSSCFAEKHQAAWKREDEKTTAALASVTP